MHSEQSLTAILHPDDQWALLRARETLEHPSLAARIMSAMGVPIESALELLPSGSYRQLRAATDRAVQGALDYAISTLPAAARVTPITRRRHYAMASFTGAVGGAFGLAALPLELPATTTLLLRGIAACAQEQGEDLQKLETQLECVKVFAFGAHSRDDDAADAGYYGTRIALALSVDSAARSVAQQGLGGAQAPIMVRLVRGVSARFGVAISQKAAAQMMPVIGAAGGALINGIFMEHFLTTAEAHFTLRRLERRYGTAMIRREYEQLH